MGGFGSGRYRYGSKETTDHYRSIDVRRWKRDGLLLNGRHFKWQWHYDEQQTSAIGVYVGNSQLHLSYRARVGDADWESFDYPVKLEYTRCNFGSERPWFRCPVDGCNRRVAILYASTVFACRHCLDLAYPCQYEYPHVRHLRRAERVLDKLRCDYWEAETVPEKPLGMHWKTYTRLVEAHAACMTASMAALGRYLA